MEHSEKQTPTAELYRQLLELEPKLISNFVPKNAVEQKKAFLQGEITYPDHHYDKLEAIDFSQRYREISILGEQLLAGSDLNPKHREVYEQFVEGYLARTHLMELAHAYKSSQDPEQQTVSRSEFMRINIEKYGVPDEVTYRSLLHEKITAITAKDLSGRATNLRDELLTMAGTSVEGDTPERFQPTQETVDWMHGVVMELYGNMLSHIPDQEIFTPTEAQAVFYTIIKEEFGEAAEEWTVELESAKSINVKASEKQIIIPEDRKPITRDSMRGLVVHEIGVHMLRAIQGADTDLSPLQTGLSEYYDSEEGLGVVMEQALKGKFEERGVDHYITAGAAYYDGMDFRQAFEMKWRLEALSQINSGDITDEAIEGSRDKAYGAVMRSMRGTDSLPWFKDLAYYNGSTDVWRHLEQIKGDEVKFAFVLMGKANPANISHERILYETATS